MDCFTPQQTIELVSRMATKKAHMRIDKLFWNSFMAGPLLGFGCAVLVSTNASPWYQENAPGLIRLLGALIFPVGLVMIVLSGADLWTTNVMYMIVALEHRRITILPLITSWVVSFLGNLAGMLFFMAIITGYGGVFEESDAYRNAAINIAMQKAGNPPFHQIFLRAIGANWLVCFAVYSSIQARELASKVIAIWWPTATFVALALDHTIANMFFIPMGIWVGAPISVGEYIWKSMIASVLGNIIGGGLFVGTAYWYLYLTGEAGVSVSFDIGSLDTAIEGGAGPLRFSGQNIMNAKMDQQAPQVIDGQALPSGAQSPVMTRPGAGPVGGATLQSAIGKELSDQSRYAKSHAERTKEEQEKDNVEQWA